jgi:ankyrin repeat protein
MSISIKKEEDLKYKKYKKDIINIVKRGNSIALAFYLSPAFAQYELINVIDDNYGCSLLMIACQHSLSTHNEVIKCLLRHGADINYVNKRGFTALGYAIQNNNFDIVKLFLLKKAYIDTYIVSIINKNTRVDIIDLLLSNGLDLELTDQDGDNLLINSVENCNYELTSMLIKRRADINVRDRIGDTPLIIALNNSDYDHIKMLVDSGADVNVKDRNGWSCLMLAIKICRHQKIDQTSFIDLFISNKANINYFNKKDECALKVAIMYNNYMIIEHIIVNNITKIIIRDNDTKISLIKNIMDLSKFDIIKLLIENKIVMMKDLLFIALYHCENIYPVYYLVDELHADVNVTNKEGETPLFCAVKHHNEELVKYFSSRSSKLSFTINTPIKSERPMFCYTNIDGRFSPLTLACHIKSLQLKYLFCREINIDNIIKILSIEMIKRNIYIDTTKLIYPFKFNEVISEAYWQSRKKLLQLSDGCPDANGHIVRYLFNELVGRDILSYIGHQDYFVTSKRYSYIV